MKLLETLKKYVPNPAARAFLITALLIIIFAIGWNTGRMLGGK